MVEEISKPAAVFFDWDGTLVDSFAFLHAAHNYTRAQFGYEPFSLEAFEGYFGQPREKLYVEIYGAENVEVAKIYFEKYVIENQAEGLKPVPGAQNLLEVMRSFGVPCGVVTNKKKELVMREIEHYGWEDFFTSVVGAGEADADKPSSAPLLMGIERADLTHLSMQDIWLVGDTDNDLLCANRAGCKTILICEQTKSVDLLANYDVNLYKENCQELADFLLQSD